VMFKEWLKEGTTISWKKLFTAIESSDGPVKGNHILRIRFAVILHIDMCTYTCMHALIHSHTYDVHTHAPALRPDHNC